MVVLHDIRHFSQTEIEFKQTFVHSYIVECRGYGPISSGSAEIAIRETSSDAIEYNQSEVDALHLAINSWKLERKTIMAC